MIPAKRIRTNWQRIRGFPVFCAALISGLVLSLTGCVLIPEDKAYQDLIGAEESVSHAYKLYPGPVRPKSELAIVALGDVPYVTVNGLGVHRTDYQEIHLLAGQHSLAWRKSFGFSVMVEPSMEKEVEYTVEANMEAGHTYRLFADRTYGAQYRFYFWIEDEGSGQVIAGTRKR